MRKNKTLRTNFTIKEINKTGLDAVVLINKNDTSLYCETNYAWYYDSKENHQNLSIKANAKIEIHSKDKIKKGAEEKSLKQHNFNGQIMRVDEKNKYWIIDCGSGFNILFSPGTDTLQKWKKGEYVLIQNATVWLYDLQFENKKEFEKIFGKNPWDKQYTLKVLEISLINGRTIFLIEKNNVQIYCKSTHNGFSTSPENKMLKTKKAKIKSKMRLDWTDIQEGSQTISIQNIGFCQYLLNGKVSEINESKGYAKVDLSFINTYIGLNPNKLFELKKWKYIKINGVFFLDIIKLIDGQKELEKITQKLPK
ncbi:MAG: hypothetical protein NTY48_06500 [Candidatus Diapherotrites archaeon]|nr:hypothetical protein [Candidatus Diapherotrites archaeon]